MNTLTSLPRGLRGVAAAAATACALLGFSFATAAELKVDINNSGRPVSEGQDPAFTPWSTTQGWFTGGDTTTATFSGVTVTFTRVGSVGTALQSGYWKTGVQSTTYNVKLTGDGLKVENGETGAQIEMRISGLSAGAHTLLLYLNNWDGITSVAPIDILVNGTQVVNDLAVSTQVTDNNNATTAYLNVTAVSGQDLVVLINAETSGSETSKNVHINGFEIDTPNIKAQANNPVPANADEHVDADTGSLTLCWGTAVLGAASHNVYFGTSVSAVTNATTASAEYKGNRTTNTYPASGINPLLTYYWRIDEVASGGAVTKGAVWTFRPRRLAFPGAEGYGRFARGGRGGVVVKVTNLNDSGPGSFRDAIEGNYGPRTVIFDVSGLLTLTNDIIVDSSRPYITIAGQTAPGKGICVKRQQFGMSGATDVICRFIRIFVGKESGETQNATGMAGVNHCIMDHCSFGWGIDEAISTRAAKNMTLQRSFISEMLNIAGHQNYPAGTKHGYAASIGGDKGTFHHNLLAHNEGRNWSLAGGLDAAGFYAGRLDIFNNVVYNWGGRTTDGGAHEVNFVNNYYKPGAASTIFTALNAQYGGFPGTQRYYFSGNVMPGYFTESNQTAGRTTGTENGGTLPENSTPPYSAWVSSPFFPSHATLHTATNAYKQVLSDTGCNQPMIDDHDTRIIGETLDGTYTYTGTGLYGGRPGMPNTTDDVGGWENYGNAVRAANWDTDNDGLPDWWETIKGLSPNSPAGNYTECNADPDGDGYTNLEDYLNWVAIPHVDCSAGTTIDVDLQGLSRGYSKTTPAYTLSSPLNGTVTLISGRYARFAPTTEANALGKFTFTVTDSAGDSMTRTVGVRIIAIPPPVPAGLIATQGNTQVSLSWGASPGATSYNVKRATTSGGPYTIIASPTGTSYVNTGLTNGITYHYVVSSVNVSGESADSSQVSATPSGLLSYEGFGYGPGANLGAKNGGTGWGLPWSQVAINYGINTATSLTYGTLATTGGAAQFGGNVTGMAVCARQFSPTLGGSAANNSGVVWLSLLYLNTGSTTAEAQIGFYGGMTADANGNTATNGSGLPHPMDVGRPPASTGAADQIYLYSGTTLVSSGVATPRGSAPAFLLLRFTLSGNATTADTLQMWVNPNLSLGEAGLGAAQAVWSTANDLEVINGLRFQESATGIVLIDEIRLGYTFADVTPTTSSPNGLTATVPTTQTSSSSTTGSGATSGGPPTLASPTRTGNIFSSNASLTVSDPERAFVESYGLDPATDGAPTADPDNDGLDNRVEWFLGGDPTRGDVSVLPVGGYSPANGAPVFTFQFNRRKSASGAAYSVEYTTDFQNWTTAVNGQGGVTITTTSPNADLDHITVTIPASSKSRLFARLRF